MLRSDDGFRWDEPSAAEALRYAYRLSDGREMPDPASRWAAGRRPQTCGRALSEQIPGPRAVERRAARTWSFTSARGALIAEGRSRYHAAAANARVGVARSRLCPSGSVSGKAPTGAPTSVHPRPRRELPRRDHGLSTWLAAAASSGRGRHSDVVQPIGPRELCSVDDPYF